ncbi:hypothetical protein RA2_00216 [Roseovarius sp. A-2]|uniref:DUF2155 domain-containing protein n=1 Tax=Roseovarius sp. A-2 TaxID=1570360 RepID=UPI0009B52C5C|nr:DUF2155 domain-containing protein [Roseovarius sp. A-2]GAW33180.1 hypothetical protein RA2_00216 [Roseovarius sp. A-2]
MIRALAASVVIAVASSSPAQEAAVQGQGAILRGLDKVNGQARDLDLNNGAATEFGSLTVEVAECRYPVENPDGDAYAFVTIHETGRNREIFSGWMLASSPALNPLEHARYDIWVLRCKI